MNEVELTDNVRFLGVVIDNRINYTYQLYTYKYTYKLFSNKVRNYK